MSDFLNLTFQGISSFAALIAVIITILLNWNVLKKFLRNKNFALIDNTVFKIRAISRRQFFVGFGSLFAGMVIWGLIKGHSTKHNIQRFLYRIFPKEQNLIINKNTGVIHHEKFCSDHLPINKNIAASVKQISNTRFHKTRKVPILYLLTKDMIAEDAIEILLLAAENNPTSVHIYDKLIKLLGKIRRYESIHLLLYNAESELRQDLLEKRPDTKEYRKYSKALKHIKMQKEKALGRARNKALRS